MANLFNTFLYQPILSLLVFIYENLAFNDLGLAIIILTVLIRIAFLPLFHKGTKSQMVMQRIQPEIEKIRHDHKDDKEKQATALLALYRQHGINPFSGFLLLIVQLPILIALYRVFLAGLSAESFPNHEFLNLIDLGNKSMLMVGLAAFAQYFQGQQVFKAKPGNGRQKTPTEQVNRYMIYMGPIFTILILGSMPAAISLYWLVTTAFSIGQQFFINKGLVEKSEPKA